MSNFVFQTVAFQIAYLVTCYYWHMYEKSKPLAYAGLALGSIAFYLFLGHFRGVHP